MVDEVFGACAGGPAPPEGPAAGRRRGRRESELLDVRVPGGRITEAGAARKHQRRPAVPRGLAGRLGGGGDQQPDGGRRDRRDRPVAAVAVDPARCHAPKTESRSRWSACRDDSGERNCGDWKRREAISRGSTAAADLLDALFAAREFPEFLTLAAYREAELGASSQHLTRQLYWGGWGRTSNLPVNSRALCQLSYTPNGHGNGAVTLLGSGPRGQVIYGRRTVRQRICCSCKPTRRSKSSRARPRVTGPPCRSGMGASLHPAASNTCAVSRFTASA